MQYHFVTKTRLDTDLAPVRGLIPVHNIHGQPFRTVDVHRWLNFVSREFVVRKLDLLSWGAIPERVEGLLDFVVEQLPVPLSLRTDATADPRRLETWVNKRLLDVFLCPPPTGPSRLPDWLEACRNLGIPARIQLQAPFRLDGAVDAHAAKWAESNVRSVNVVVSDPFQPVTTAPDSEQARRCLDFVNAFASSLVAHDIEINLVGFPANVVSESLRPYARSREAFFHDHQHYERGAYEMAVDLFARSPRVVRSIILAKLVRHASFDNPTDRHLVRVLSLSSTRLYSAMVLWSKLWRTFYGQRHALKDSGGRARPDTAEQNRLSHGELATFRKMFPGVNAEPDTAGVPREAMARYLDPVDWSRFHEKQQRQAMAREALDWERRERPAKEISADTFGCDNGYFRFMPGANQWVTASGGEKRSNILDSLEAPFMVSVTFGGGLAECIGFAFGKHIRLMCPMVNTSHLLHLYVDPAGNYVLLRDKQLVEYVEVPGRARVPVRIPAIRDLQLCIWNIHEEISASSVKFWTAPPDRDVPPHGITFSVCIFSTRFSRRLEAVLKSLAHQRDFAMERLEVLVAYVPGLDATEDVLDSMRHIYPELRLVHMPFSSQFERSKGFALNETMAAASGEWIMLLDSDTLVPPDMFARLDALREGQSFMAPVGRAMLDAPTTAGILLGETLPWDAWDRLLESAPDLRVREAKGVPIGFCQIFRASCLEKVRYPEYEHFQGADWEFGTAMRKHFGDELRLEFPLIHLDHAGSQWYGTQQHL